MNVYVALLISSTSIARTVESRITFPTELFESYEVQDMNNSDRLTSNSNCVVKFDVNLKTLIDCLQLFGSNMNMENNNSNNSNIGVTMNYNTMDMIFNITLEDVGVITVCELHTISSNDTLTNLNSMYLFTLFREHPVVAQIIMKSNVLHDMMTEILDIHDKERISFEILNKDNKKTMRIQTNNQVECCELELTE